MGVDFLYKTPVGRSLLWAVMHSGVIRPAAAFLNSGASRCLIRPYAKKNGIDLRGFPEKFHSFGDFFGRYRPLPPVELPENVLISPCDSFLSAYPIEDGTCLKIKGSAYRIRDLVTDEEQAEKFADGLCMIFRLCPSDYHHFCYIDDCEQLPTRFVPGQLHSVQPIACETVPVYRLNRRQWSLLDTDHFGPVAQIEVGALMVGGMVHVKEGGRCARGEEMGYFTLSGSTVVLLFTKSFRENFRFLPALLPALGTDCEVKVHQAQSLGTLK